MAMNSQEKLITPQCPPVDKPHCHEAMEVNRMARELGFEPATYGLEGRCSIQLSYSRIIYLGYSRGRFRQVESKVSRSTGFRNDLAERELSGFSSWIANSMTDSEKQTQPDEIPQTSKLATASMIMGFIGIPLIGSLTGHYALLKINRSKGAMKGKKFALTGIFLGYLNVLLILLLIVLVKYFIEAWSRLPF